MSTRNRFISEIFDNIPEGEKEEIDKRIEEEIKWLDEHPDFNERYGTDKSYWLQNIINKGFNPVGITIIMGEETLIMGSEEEVTEAWEEFKPQGFWYTKQQIKDEIEEIIDTIYDGDINGMDKIYWL